MDRDPAATPLPNALIPSVTVLGLTLGDLLYGAVLTETVFAWPGMGAYVVKSIQSLDFPGGDGLRHSGVSLSMYC